MRNHDTLFVYIANIAEPLQKYISADPERGIFFNQLGDRVVLYKGDHKVTITSYPILHLHYWQEITGVSFLANLSPTHPSLSLCDDILKDSTLWNNLWNVCQDKSQVNLIPYCSTQDFIKLANQLTFALGLQGVKVIAPETPNDESSLWLWQYIGTKIGFRNLGPKWLGEGTDIGLPEGYIAQNATEAVQIVNWFISRGRECICKTSHGVGGFGIVRFLANDFGMTAQEIYLKLSSTLNDRLFPVIVEEFIRGKSSPSSEAFVPDKGDDQVKMLYICEQVFDDKGLFDGVIIDKSVVSTCACSLITKCTMKIGNELQELGYRGIFDLDFIISEKDQKIYILEVNLRRTGGTHAHEIAALLYGENYQDNHSVLSIHDLVMPNRFEWERLISLLQPYTFPMKERNEGLIISKVSALPLNVGLIILANTRKNIETIYGDVLKTLRHHAS